MPNLVKLGQDIFNNTPQLKLVDDLEDSTSIIREKIM